MNEITLQNLFENYLIKNNIPYERESQIQNYIIDFKIKIGDRYYGVEVKSSKGNIFHALGQLLLAKKTFSHIYLLAPEEFVSKTQDVVENIGIGIIMIKDGNFSFLKKPKPQTYYFNPPEKVEIKEPKTKNLIICDKDYSILVNFENKVFNYLDVVKLFKTTRVDAYARINRLLKVGLVEKESSFNPKTYRVKKVVDWGTKIQLQ